MAPNFLSYISHFSLSQLGSSQLVILGTVFHLPNFMLFTYPCLQMNASSTPFTTTNHADFRASEMQTSFPTLTSFHIPNSPNISSFLEYFPSPYLKLLYLPLKYCHTFLIKSFMNSLFYYSLSSYHICHSRFQALPKEELCFAKRKHVIVVVEWYLDK